MAALRALKSREAPAGGELLIYMERVEMKIRGLLSLGSEQIKKIGRN